MFLDDLWKEFEKLKDSRPKLQKFHDRLRELRFFDPACGCGNFLIIAYRELRLLEIEVIKILLKENIAKKLSITNIVKKEPKVTSLRGNMRFLRETRVKNIKPISVAISPLRSRNPRLRHCEEICVFSERLELKILSIFPWQSPYCRVEITVTHKCF